MVSNQCVQTVLLYLQQAVFPICCIVILSVSVHDTLLIITNHEVIGQVEQNPVGVWLLDLQDGSIWLFVAVKLIATSLVVAIIVSIRRKHRKLGTVVACALAVFQIVLLIYLSIG